MYAMILNKISNFNDNQTPLSLVELPEPEPGMDEILIKVSACGVCHTELDEIEGRTPPPILPCILGHQAIGEVIQIGDSVKEHYIGDRVGVAWIFSACGECKFCLNNQENLCPSFKATGRDANGGYAQYIKVPAHFAYRIPADLSDSEAAPLLCAGAIGFRSLKLSGLRDGQKLGLTGFGASGHIVLKIVKNLFPNSQVFVFSRSESERDFALEIGASWSGAIETDSPEKLDCIIDTTPVWKPIIESLKNLEPGGRLVINAIRKEEVDKDYLLQLNYPTHLWLEKEIKSVANITRSDVKEFLTLSANIPIKPEVQEFALGDANQALLELKTRKIRGAKVLRI